MLQTKSLQKLNLPAFAQYSPILASVFGKLTANRGADAHINSRFFRMTAYYSQGIL
jgi:hypothetical protein